MVRSSTRRNGPARCGRGWIRSTSRSQQAQARWPALGGDTRHAITMSGEMVDAVRASRRGRAAHRGSAGAGHLRGEVRLLRRRPAAGLRQPTQRGAVDADRIGQLARHRAPCGDGLPRDGLLVDIGSTTTDLIACWQMGACKPRAAATTSGWQRRAGLSRRRAHATVRTGEAQLPFAVPGQRDERMVRDHGGRLPDDRRARPGTRSAAECRRTVEGPHGTPGSDLHG
jgi:hypothetical protein